MSDVRWRARHLIARYRNTLMPRLDPASLKQLTPFHPLPSSPLIWLCVFLSCACPSCVVCVVEGEWCRGGTELEAFSTSKHLSVYLCEFLRACMRHAWAGQAEPLTVKTCTYFSCWKSGGRQRRVGKRCKEARGTQLAGLICEYLKQRWEKGSSEATCSRGLGSIGV